MCMPSRKVRLVHMHTRSCMCLCLCLAVVLGADICAFRSYFVARVLNHNHVSRTGDTHEAAGKICTEGVLCL